MAPLCQGFLNIQQIARRQSAVYAGIAGIRTPGGRFAPGAAALLTLGCEDIHVTFMASAQAAERRDPQSPDRQAIDQAVAALAAKFGNRLVTSRAVREQHGNTITWIENQPP